MVGKKGDREAAIAEERRGAKVWIGNGRVLIEGEW